MCGNLLGVVGSGLKNLSQRYPICRNSVAKRVQHVVLNDVAMCYVEMLARDPGCLKGG